MKLCVYCASSSQINEIYKTATRDVGSFCAKNGIDIVYGGGHVGLMGMLADAALAEGAKVYGVIPDFLEKKEVGHQGLTELTITHTMQERQTKMAELSDAFLVLPGGLGTLAELFEIITWKQLSLHDKPIYIWNINGYWNELIAMLDKAHNEGFIRQVPTDLYQPLVKLDDIHTQR